LTQALLDFVREHAGSEMGGQLVAYDAALAPVEGDAEGAAIGTRGQLNDI
jgi:hypothetical protein